MKKTNSTVILLILLLISVSLNVFFCIKTVTNTEKDNASEQESVIDNSQFENQRSITVFVSAKIPSSDYYPNHYDSKYVLEYEKDTDTLHFEYYPRSSSTNCTKADFSGDIFFEIRDMILKDQVTPYEFPTDSNGKRVASKEKLPYYIYFRDVGINTPDNIDEIVQRLEELRENA